jgi:hypothetical protein
MVRGRNRSQSLERRGAQSPIPRSGEIARASAHAGRLRRGPTGSSSRRLDQAGGTLLRGFAAVAALAAVAGAIEQGAAPLRDGLQHVAEEGGIHRTEALAMPHIR